MPADWAGLTAEAQAADEQSTLSFFRRMLRLRREVTTGLGADVVMLDPEPGILAFRRDSLLCVVNCGTQPSSLPAGAGELLISSGADPVDGLLAPDTAAWFRTAAAG
jgi:alpha-glucosidase